MLPPEVWRNILLKSAAFDKRCLWQVICKQLRPIMTTASCCALPPVVPDLSKYPQLQKVFLHVRSKEAEHFFRQHSLLISIVAPAHKIIVSLAPSDLQHLKYIPNSIQISNVTSLVVQVKSQAQCGAITRLIPACFRLISVSVVQIIRGDMCVSISSPTAKR